jgi:hypothetical protein
VEGYKDNVHAKIIFSVINPVTNISSYIDAFNAIFYIYRSVELLLAENS